MILTIIRPILLGGHLFLGREVTQDGMRQSMIFSELNWGNEIRAGYKAQPMTKSLATSTWPQYDAEQSRARKTEPIQITPRRPESNFEHLNIWTGNWSKVTSELILPYPLVN